MTECSKCGIEVVPGDYVEIDNKRVCLPCALKKGKVTKEHVNGFLERFIRQKPLGLRLIIYFLLLNFILYFVSIPVYGTASIIIYSLVGIVFLLLVIGLSFFLKIARDTTIILAFISILAELLFVQGIFSAIRIILLVIIIIYLSKPSVRKLFV